MVIELLEPRACRARGPEAGREAAWHGFALENGYPMAALRESQGGREAKCPGPQDSHATVIQVGMLQSL